MSFTDTVRTLTRGDADVGLPLSGADYVERDEAFEPARRFVEDSVQVEAAGSVFFDTTTLHTIEQLLLRRDSDCVNPATLLDLATFVNAAVLADHAFQIENVATDPLVLNEALGEPFVIALPLHLFDADGDAGAEVLEDMWDRARQHLDHLRLYDEPWDDMHEERVALARGWETLLGRSVSVDAILDDLEITTGFGTNGPALLRRLLESQDHVNEELRFVHYGPGYEAGAGSGEVPLMRLVTECNYRCCFNASVAHMLGIPYLPNSYRMPYNRFLVERARLVQVELKSLEIVEREFAAQAKQLRSDDDHDLRLPIFLTSVLAECRELDDFWPALARARAQAATFRSHRRELDAALHSGDAKAEQDLREAVALDAGKLRAESAAQSAAGAGAAALSSVTDGPGTLVLAAIAVLAFASAYSSQAAWRIGRRATRVRRRLVMKRADAAWSLLNAYPRVAELWDLPAAAQRDFSEQFARLAKL